MPISHSQKPGARAAQEFHEFTTGWVKGPDLGLGKSNHACGVIRDSFDNASLVIAAGGYEDSYTEILVNGFETASWIWVDALPFAMSSTGGVTSPDSNSFLFIGGYNYNTRNFQNDIYQLQCHNLNCEWAMLDKKLVVARDEHIAAFVPDSVLNCV